MSIFGVSVSVGNLAHAASQTVSPTQLSSSTALTNPLSGLYAWHDLNYANATPSNWPMIDSYGRFSWKEIEPTQGTYNFALIDNALANAKSHGGQYGFRIMPICLGCGPSQQDALPTDIANDPSTWSITDSGSGYVYKIPDWNSSFYQTRWSQFMKALGDRYRNDSRLGYIDFGGYGNWGEQHLWPAVDYYPGPSGQALPTVASLEALYQAVIDNFPNTYKELNAPHVYSNVDKTVDHALSGAVLNHVLQASKTVGFRKDCIGSDSNQVIPEDILTAAQAQAVAAGVALEDQPLERWRIAPITTEWCGTISPTSNITTDSFTNGLAQITREHIATLSDGNWTNAPDISAYSTTEQASYTTSLTTAGYRYTINSATLPDTITAGSQLPLQVLFQNTNTTPTYRNWQVTYQIRNAAGAVVASANSPLELRTLLPGASTATDSTSINTSSLALGTYSVYVVATDKASYYQPLSIAIQGREADGAYKLANFSVVAAPATPAPTPAQNTSTPTSSGLASTGSSVAVPLIGTLIAVAGATAFLSILKARR